MLELASAAPMILYRFTFNNIASRSPCDLADRIRMMPSIRVFKAQTHESISKSIVLWNVTLMYEPQVIYSASPAKKNA